MSDLWWCETHEWSADTGPTDPYFVGCDIGHSTFTAGACVVVPLRPSRDAAGRLLGLLVEEECPLLTDSYGVRHESKRPNHSCQDEGCGPCPECGGTGRRLRALVIVIGQEVVVREGMVAMLPVGKETTP